MSSHEDPLIPFNAKIFRDPETKLFPSVVVRDSAGRPVFSVSVQASSSHHSSPKSDMPSLNDYDSAELAIYGIPDELERAGLLMDSLAGAENRADKGQDPLGLDYIDVGGCTVLLTHVQLHSESAGDPSELEVILQRLAVLAHQHGKARLLLAEAIQRAFDGSSIHQSLDAVAKTLARPPASAGLPKDDRLRNDLVVHDLRQKIQNIDGAPLFTNTEMHQLLSVYAIMRLARKSSAGRGGGGRVLSVNEEPTSPSMG